MFGTFRRSRASRHFFQNRHRHFSCSSSVNLTKLSKKDCVFFIQRCRSMRQMKQVHCQILLSQLHQNKDVMDDLLVFCTNPQNGDLSHAEKIFDALENPSLFVHNLMIKALTRNGSFRKSVFLLHRMREMGLSPDNFTYPLVLKAIGGLREIDEGRETHGLIVKSGMESDPYVGNSLLNMYADLGCLQMSRQLFDEMPKRDVISWNVMISSYASKGKKKDAIDVFRKLQEEGVEPDEATLVSTLSACSAIGDLETGRDIHHRYIGKKFVRYTLPLYNALLDMYAKSGSFVVALKIFDEMPKRNVVSWTSIISGFINAGLLREAKELFHRSPSRDVVLWTAMINGYVRHNHFEDALAMFREMQLQRIEPDKFTVVALLSASANLGALDQGRWIHGFVKENAVPIDAVLGTALVDMYAKCGCVEESMEVFVNVGGKDTGLWTSAIFGLAMNGQTSRALEVFSEMSKAGVQPDDITFIAVLSACSHGGLVDKGRQLFHSMKELHGIEPKIEHFGCLIDLLGRAGLLEEAAKLMEEIPGRRDEEIAPFCGALLAACRNHANVEMVGKIDQRIAELESTDSGLHTILANVYAAAERWEEVGKVRGKMKKLGVKKTPGCSSIELGGAIREFVAGDASHSEFAEIFRVLNSIKKVIHLEKNMEMTELLQD